MEKGYGAWKAYGRSKLANFHFGLGLDKLLREQEWPVASLVAHPGLSDTDLQATTVANSDGAAFARISTHDHGPTTQLGVVSLFDRSVEARDIDENDHGVGGLRPGPATARCLFRWVGG